MHKLKFCILLVASVILYSCFQPQKKTKLPWEKHGKLKVAEAAQLIQHYDGTPFLWLGCTAWGMTEWLNREEVDLYLDDRKSKGMNVVQLCLVWGKRTDYPTRFTANAPNAYGHKAFVEVDSVPDVLQPAIAEGGSKENPNDYWDHVDYCIDAIKKRGMYAAILPFWGRRYVNGTHGEHSLKMFTKENICQYGEFLGKRYASEPHIIWVNGGDVKATAGGDFIQHYRLLAEGLVKGASGLTVKWDQKSKAWDFVLLTYHPDGTPMVNSSEWFHNDVWLDFNMIETHKSRDKIVVSIQQDLLKLPQKPTVMGEGHYEGTTTGKKAEAIHIRRQAYQTFFAGAAGHTYGGAFDDEGNGPLFSPANNWKRLLNWEGAGQIIHLRNFLESNNWYTWKPTAHLISEGRGEGELEKLAIETDRSVLIYFPENSTCRLKVENVEEVSWYNTKNGTTITGLKSENNEYGPPDGWEDGILILES